MKASAMRADAYRFLRSIPVKLSAGASLVALADVFFYNHPLGWAAGIYGAALLGTLALLHGGLLRQMTSQIITAMLIALCAALINAPQLLPLSLFAAGIVALLILHKRAGAQDAGTWIRDFMRFMFHGLMQWEEDASRMRRLRWKKKLPDLRVLARLCYMLVPVALAIVFALLFTQANPVIARIVDEIDWDFIEEILSPWRGAFWLCAAVVIWALLRPRFHTAAAKTGTGTPRDLSRWFSPASIALSLILFNAMFAGENALDIAFLWSAQALPKGVSYASYAHAGAYPLIVTALLAGVYILITFGDRRYQTRLSVALVYFWIAQNIFLVASAIDRNFHYIEVYSLTYWRLSAMIWMGLVAGGLALTVIKIAAGRGNMWLINTNLLAAIATLYGCCFVDFDRIIADYNVRHAREVTGIGTDLDLDYMRELGPEAIPALRWFQDHARFNPAKALQAEDLADAEETSLALILRSDWRAWTMRSQARLEDIQTRRTGSGWP